MPTNCLEFPYTQTVAPTLTANVNGVDASKKTIDSFGTDGNFVRGQISRNGVVIELTPIEINNPITGIEISFTADLENGDEVCVLTSDNGISFTPSYQDCVIIPTPGFTFTELIGNEIYISFDDSELLFPNSVSTDTVKVFFDFVDDNGNTGTVELNGNLGPILAINDGSPLVIDGISGTTMINSAFGVVMVISTFDAGYDTNLNNNILSRIIDQRNVTSAEDEIGITTAIMANASTYLMNEAGEVLIFRNPNVMVIGGKKPSELGNLAAPVAGDLLVVEEAASGTVFNATKNSVAPTVSVSQSAPFEVTFDNVANQSVFTFAPGDLGGNTDINTAININMYVDGIKVSRTEYPITGALEITKTPAINSNQVLFEFFF